MSSIQWYSFTDIPDEYFFKLLGPTSIKKEPQPINVFDEVSTLQGIKRNLNKEWLALTYTKFASLYSLFKKGYIILAITGDKEKDATSDMVLFGDDNQLENALREGEIVAECNFDSLYTEHRSCYPYYNLSAMITDKGYTWLSEMKNKYPELFEPQMDVRDRLPRKREYPVDFPEGYSKSGTQEVG